MKYSGIIYNDVVAGPGFFLTFFTSGCPHHCPGCQNPQTWDENYGYEFTDDTIREIINSLHKNGVERGLAIQGGEPLYSHNLEIVDRIITAVKAIYSTTPVYIWTGGIFESHLKDAESNSTLRHILSLTDVLIDGPYQEDKRDITLYLRGSSNQRVIDVQASLQKGETVCLV